MQIEVLMRFALLFVLGACIWAAGNKARAQQTIPATATTETATYGYQITSGQQRWYVYNTGSGLWPTKIEACAAWVQSFGSAASCPVVTPGTAAGGNDGCQYFWAPNGGTCPNAGNAPIVEGAPLCPSGYSVYNGNQCRSDTPQCPAEFTGPTNGQCTRTTYSCPEGYTLSGTTCTQNVTIMPAGQSCGNMAIPASASPGAGGCVNGTLCYFDNASNQYAVGGQQVWYGPGRSSGQPCSGQPNSAGSNPETQCPPGKVPGTINGQTHCFTASENNPAVKVESTTQTTTNAQGQTTQGPTTTTTTTDRGTAGTTTQTTTRNPDGSSTQTTQNGGPQDTRPEMQRFCDENPEAPACKQSSWGGTCGAFVCDGDAVECAMAREQHQRNCTLFDTQTALSTLGNQVSSGADPQASQNPALEANRQTFNLTGSLSQETFLAQGGLTDQQITVTPWLTVTLPWSQLNYYLALMGAIVVAFALVFAARIVIGAK